MYVRSASPAAWERTSPRSMDVPPAIRAAFASAASSCLLEIACVARMYMRPYQRNGRWIDWMSQWPLPARVSIVRPMASLVR